MRRHLSFNKEGLPGPVREDQLRQSLSDDQLYRGRRRSSIYEGFISDGAKDDRKDLSEIKTSEGKPLLRRKIIEFEGDGPLGIVFTEANRSMIIKSIMKGSVSSEYYELSIGMTVIQINDVSCRELGYVHSMEHLGRVWRSSSRVTLHFEYENMNDIINDPKFDPIYKFLEGINCSEFYVHFNELGAKEVGDLNFIEYDDLVKMNMSPIQRRIFQSRVQDDYKSDGKSIVTLSFHPKIEESERIDEIDRITKLLDSDYIINVSDDRLEDAIDRLEDAIDV